MSAFDKMLSQRFVVIGRGLKAEDRFYKVMLNFQRLCQRQQLSEALNCVVKDQTLMQRPADRRSEKSMVLLFGYVDAYDQILSRAAYLFLELPELLKSDKIYFHRDLLLMNFVSP